MMHSSHFSGTGGDSGSNHDDDPFASNPFRSSGATATTSDPNDPFYSHPLSTPPSSASSAAPPPRSSSVEGPPLWSTAAAATPATAPVSSPPPQWGAPSRQQQQPDPHSGMMGSFPPSLSSVPLQASTTAAATSAMSTTLSGTMDAAAATRGGYGSSNEEISSTPFGWFQRCASCFKLDGYRPYFDFDTTDIAQRLQASLTLWWQPDGFRTNFLGDGIKPDLYGPIWIALTLAFVLALSANWTAAFAYHPTASSAVAPTTTTPTQGNNSTVPYVSPTPYSSQSFAAFEYDLHPLARSLTAVGLFAGAFPSFLWLAASCLGLQPDPALSWATWVCLYGYSLTVYIPTSLLLLVLPSWSILRWTFLACATAASALLVLRNVSGPLLAHPNDPTKASPLITSVLGGHCAWLLLLKVGFFR